jgi:hypothetical protein
MKKDFCVFSIFYKEYFFTSYWQNYYGNLFGFDNLFILGEPERDPFLKLFHKDVNIIDFGAEKHQDHAFHVRRMVQTQTSLLNFYNTVIFAEADEFIVPNLYKYENLKEFLKNNDDNYLTVQGYNIHQNLDEETIINPSLPLLKQRKWWYREKSEDKTLIVKKPVLTYSSGFHFCAPQFAPNSDLFNLHCKYLDYNIQNVRANIHLESDLPISEENGTIHNPKTFLFNTDEKLKNYHRSRFEYPEKHVSDSLAGQPGDPYTIEYINEMFTNSNLF